MRPSCDNFGPRCSFQLFSSVFGTAEHESLHKALAWSRPIVFSLVKSSRLQLVPMVFQIVSGTLAEKRQSGLQDQTLAPNW